MFSFQQGSVFRLAKAALSSFVEKAAGFSKHSALLQTETSTQPQRRQDPTAPVTAFAGRLPDDDRIGGSLGGICFGSDIVFPCNFAGLLFRRLASFSDVAAKVPDVGTVSRLSEAAVVFSLSDEAAHENGEDKRFQRLSR